MRRQLRRQKPQMLRALRQHQRKTTSLCRRDYVPADQPVAVRVLGQSLVQPLELDSRVCCWEVRRAEARGANQHMVSERPRGRLLPGVVTVAHRAALHEDDRLMAVFARGRGGEAGNIARFGAAGDQFKAARREMVAFIHHQVAVRSNTVMHDTLPHQALNEGHVDTAGEVLPAASEPADGLGRHIEKTGQAFHPLFQQLLAVHENQAVDATARDKPGSKHGFAKGRRGGQDPNIVSRHGVRRQLLFRPQLTMEAHVERGAAKSFIAQRRLDAQRGKQACVSPRQPRGSARYFGPSSAQWMTRGLPKVDSRMACAR